MHRQRDNLKPLRTRLPYLGQNSKLPCLAKEVKKTFNICNKHSRIQNVLINEIIDTYQKAREVLRHVALKSVNIIC